MEIVLFVLSGSFFFLMHRAWLWYVSEKIEYDREDLQASITFLENDITQIDRYIESLN